ncbi:MAG: glutamate-1-semialdehyde-2,1-aminomutase [Candidatus Marinimicrobia bacterium]|nr:glutamate-1-semialdehyde-2,1-aminomutase [Candidatus Neomarinimicrobiota bacterium]
MNTITNAGLFERACRVIPGGVDSPVRAFRAVGGAPYFISKAKGAHIFDEEGGKYLDFMGSWGPLILGHAHAEVVEAIKQASSRGTTYGAPCRAEIELAEMVVSAYPGLEQVRFVSSGTEATMSAIRLARGATGRDLVVKFSGCYHGHADHLLVAAGSGLVTSGKPSSAGVPADFAALTRVLPLNDEEALHELFIAEGEKIAAVIIEPMPANNGLLLQRKEFLQSVRKITQAHGAILIFDEVISGFRVAKGGAASIFGITPDLATFGKIIGGGLPVGAFGGLRKLMANMAPEGPVYQAGTLSGNPVAMAAGIATLKVLEREDTWSRLEDLGTHLDSELNAVLENSSVPGALVRAGSIFWLSLQAGGVPRSAEAIDAKAGQAFKPFFHALLNQGICIPPSAYEVMFLSLAHTADDVSQLAQAIRAALTAITT